MKKDNLIDIRKKLDKIDNKIITLLAERQMYMPDVGKIKSEGGTGCSFRLTFLLVRSIFVFRRLSKMLCCCWLNKHNQITPNI